MVDVRNFSIGPKNFAFRFDYDEYPYLFKFSDVTDIRVLSSNASGEINLVPASTAGLAPADAEYIVAASHTGLSAERVLSGTANQVTVTLGVGTCVLSTPQDIHTGASPTFAGLTLSGLNVAGFVKNNASGVLSGGNSVAIDISTDTNLAVTAPIVLTGDTLSFDYNTTNLQVTASQLNTIQNIATTSSPTFVDLTLTDDISVAGDISQTGTGSTSFRGDVSKSVIIQADSSLSQLTLKGYRASSTPGQFVFASARGTQSAPAIFSDLERLGRIVAQGYGATDFQFASAIDFYTGTGTQSDTVMPGQIRFLTCPQSVTLTLGMTIDENQDIVVENQILSTLDVDSFLDLNVSGSDVRLASARDLILDIDYDSTTTGRTFKVRTNNATDLFEVQEDGDVVVPLGDLYIVDQLISNTLASNYLDLTYVSSGVLLSSENLCYINVGSGTGTGAFHVNNNAGNIIIQGLQNGDVKIPSGDLYLSSQLKSTLNSNEIDLATGGTSTSIELTANHDILINIDEDNNGGGVFLVAKNAGATSLFSVENDGDVSVTIGNLRTETAGKGLYIKEGADAMMGTATLVGGTIAVATTAVTANSRIFYNRKTTGGTIGHLRVSARSAGTSFTITSSSGTETSSIDWVLIEPA